MNTAIEQMLKNYRVENIYDRKNAMKEIMQEIVLCGLSRAGFSRRLRSTVEPPCESSTVSTVFPKIWIFRWKRRIWTLT